MKYSAKFECKTGVPMKEIKGRRNQPDVQITFTPGLLTPSPCPVPPAIYKFTLSPQTTWMQGTSTDFGADRAVDPDYVFERGLVAGYPTALNTTLAPPQDGGLSISTAQPTPYAVDVTVTSRDFGGAARLYAEATLPGGPAFNVEVVEDVNPPPGQHVVDVEIPTGAPCGQNFKTRAFASLPVDQNCNGIADGWEASYGLMGAATDDLDQAENGGSTVGDGLTVHEEYRGFHYIDRSSGNPVVTWTSTDPVRKLDLFFWDHDSLFREDLAYFRGQFPSIELREVDERMGLDYEADPDHGARVSKINVNSTSPRSAYPLLLINKFLGAVCAGPRATGGVLGHAPDFPPANGPDGRAIRLDNPGLNSCADLFHFPRSDWRQILVAHEIGHNLGRRHPAAIWTYAALPYIGDFANLATLPVDKYTFQAPLSGQFYIWLRDYLDASVGAPGIRRVAEKAVFDVGALAGLTLTRRDGPYFSNLAAQKGLYRHLTAPALPAAPSWMQILTAPMNGLQSNVMNWTPRVDPPFHSTNAYSFSANDVKTVCVKPCPLP